MLGRRKNGFLYLICGIATIFIVAICVMVGSVKISFWQALQVLVGSFFDQIPMEVPERIVTIITKVRMPRVFMAAFVGAALALCGAVMQGLLRNPLADGSTLGVSSGASLGAVVAIALSSGSSFWSEFGIFSMSVAFAFLSMFIIMALARVLDYSLSTNTILLIGVIFSMFAGSMTSLVITVASNKVKDIIFWSMGSFAGSSYGEVVIMALVLLVAGGILIHHGRELNAFAVGEENAMYIGVNIRRVKLTIMIVVSALIGISVAISGTIGFVGLIVPHISRLIIGPNHKNLLPMSVFMGAIFMMMADLFSRTLFRPMEIPIGVITSFVGSILFIYLYARFSKRK